METVKTLLTIDFDMFVPEKPEWDIGHNESRIYLKMLWGTRVYLMDLMKTDGNEVVFLGLAGETGKSQEYAVFRV